MPAAPDSFTMPLTMPFVDVGDTISTVRSKPQDNDRASRLSGDEARRAHLVRCAIDAIGELGLRRASLAEIGRRSGLSKAAIFYHFTGRDDLIRQVVATVLIRGAEYMAARSAGLDAPAEQLRAYIESNVEYIASHRDDVKVLTAIALDFIDDDGASKLENNASVYDLSLAPLRDILGRGQQQRVFAEFDTRTMAMTIRAAIDAIGPQLTVIPDLDLAGYARELSALFDRATRRTS